MDNNPIMNEFWKGFAEFIRAFWHSASKQGFSIMLLVVVNIGMALWINNINKDRNIERLEYKQDLADLRNEYRKEISEMNARIDTCQRAMSDCAAANAKLEGEKAALLALLRKKH